MSDPSFGQWPVSEAPSGGGVVTWTDVIDTPGTHDVQTGELVVNLYEGQAEPGIVLRFPASPADGTIVNTKEAVNNAGVVTFTTQGSKQIEGIDGGFSVPSFSLGASDYNVAIRWAYDANGNAWRMLNFYRPETVP